MRFLVLLLLTGVGLVTPAHAHGFGQRYDLPIPLSFYVFGAGATVAFSFAAAVLFLQAPSTAHAKPLPLLRSTKLQRWANVAARALRVLAVGYFGLMLIAGLFGVQTPERNIIVASIWIVGWVGISLLSALAGDLWRFLNPWAALFAAVEQIYTRLTAGRSLAIGLPYPTRLDVWPALVLFVGFAWMELVWSGRDVPAKLAHAMLLYSAMTWAGMFAFGREVWIKHVEVFTIVFGVFARFAPLAPAEDGRHGLILRWPSAGLLQDRRTSLAMMLLVIALLATVTFDGILETPLWARVDIAIIDAPDDSLLWTLFHFSEASALRFARTIGLVIIVLLFSAVYLLACKAMAAATGNKRGGAVELGRQFVFSLLPISIAYHIAHYFSYLFNGGQIMIPLLSDPLGFGWDLFGTATYRPDIGFVGPLMQWYVAVGAIVVGHVIAVWLAHLMALAKFGDRGLALRSQLPVLVLMVCYTMLSLWILSQPIVETTSGG